MSGSVETRPTVLVFHKLTSGFTYGVTNYSPRRLHALIEALTHGGWRFDCSDACHDELEKGRGCLELSFDDGYEHLVDALPEFVARYRLRPLIFVPTDLEGKENSWDYSHVFRPFRHLSRVQMRQLAQQGVRFGSHGASHGDLTQISSKALSRELSEARRRLQEWTGQEVDSISYPFGRCNRRVRDAAQEAGYRFAYTMKFPSAEDDDLARGRVPVYGFDTSLSVHAKLGGGFAGGLERAKSGVVGRLSGGTVWLNRLRGRWGRRTQT